MSRQTRRHYAESIISDYTDRRKKQKKKRIEIAETWDSIPLAQVIRGSMLITQSTLIKYITLPSLIIAKNIGRILLLQAPEWSEDLLEWTIFYKS